MARFVQERTPGLPLFLLGHSLGGVIVLNYAIRYPEGLRGVVAISPALGEVGIAPTKRALCADEVTADLQRWLEAHLD